MHSANDQSTHRVATPTGSATLPPAIPTSTPGITSIHPTPVQSSNNALLTMLRGLEARLDASEQRWAPSYAPPRPEPDPPYGTPYSWASPSWIQSGIATTSVAVTVPPPPFTLPISTPATASGEFTHTSHGLRQPSHVVRPPLSQHSSACDPPAIRFGTDAPTPRYWEVATARLGPHSYHSDTVRQIQMDPPVFDGYDARSWVTRIQYYFDHIMIPDDQRLHFVFGLFSTPVFDWICSYRENNPFVSWTQFLEDVLCCFDPNYFVNYSELIDTHTQSGSVSDYHREFEGMLHPIMCWPEPTSTTVATDTLTLRDLPKLPIVCLTSADNAEMQLEVVAEVDGDEVIALNDGVSIMAMEEEGVHKLGCAEQESGVVDGVSTAASDESLVEDEHNETADTSFSLFASLLDAGLLKLMPIPDLILRLKSSCRSSYGAHARYRIIEDQLMRQNARCLFDDVATRSLLWYLYGIALFLWESHKFDVDAGVSAALNDASPIELADAGPDSPLAQSIDRARVHAHVVLVATDAASRGLDIFGDRIVVHYQFPRSAEIYVHRCGITDSASTHGYSIVRISPIVASKFASLCRSFSRENLQSYTLSRDHKPDLEVARERIFIAGGFIHDGCVPGSFNLVRVIGDMELKRNTFLPPEKQIVTANSDLYKVAFCPDAVFIMLACASFWDCMSSHQLVDFLRDPLQSETKLPAVCAKVLACCLAPSIAGGGGCDNMPMLLVQFTKHYPPACSAAFILDPHYLVQVASRKCLPPGTCLPYEHEKDVDKLAIRLMSGEEAHIVLLELMTWTLGPIAAAHIIRDERERVNVEFRPSKQKIADAAVLRAYRLWQRKEYEDSIRRAWCTQSSWVKYAQWEESHKAFDRVRSVWERAREALNYRDHTLWLHYADFEMKYKFLDRARNVGDRARKLLPRIDQLGYRHIHMEEFFMPFEMWDNVLVAICRKHGSFSAFLSVFHECCSMAIEEKIHFRRPNLAACNAALACYCREVASVADAEKVIETMSLLRIEADDVTFGSFAYLYAVKGLKGKVFELEAVLEKLGSFSCSLHVHVHNLICGLKCQEIYDHLQKILGIKHELEAGISWSIIQRTDASSPSERGFPLRVECNSKLVVALYVMDECFLPFIDRRNQNTHRFQHLILEDKKVFNGGGVDTNISYP